MSELTEADIVAQLDAQHTKYTADPSLVGEPVQADHNARVVAANAAKVAVTNAQFDTLVSTAVPDTRGVVTGNVYDGGNVVTPVDATFMETQVRAALDADELFTHGGPYTSDYSLASPYVDGLTLIEGSKLTGEKFY